MAWTIPSSLNGQFLDGDDYKIKWVAWDNSPNHNPDASYSTGWLTIRPSSTPATTFTPPWGNGAFTYYDGRSFYYDQDHLGADINLTEGTAIRAGVTGRIVKYGPATGYGILVAVIEVDLGQTQSFVNANGQPVETSKVLWILGHLRPTQNRDGGGQSLNWRVGDTVSPNDIIGFVENDVLNGDGAEHLHLGLRLQSMAQAVAVDPSAWFRGYEGGSGMGQYYGNPVSALAVAAGVPSAPTGLIGRYDGVTGIFVDWSDVPGAGDYRLFRAESPDGPWNNQIYLDNGSQYNDSNDTVVHISSGTPYYYRVKAVNSAGDSAFSAVVGPVTIPVLPPQPANLRAEPVSGTSSVRLEWDAVLPTPIGYSIERSTRPDFASFTRKETQDSVYIDSVDTVPGITYYYRVRARTSGSLSVPSTPRNATVLSSQKNPISQGAVGTLNPTPYDAVARVYRWNQGQWVNIVNQPVESWDRQTVILTHGWNDTLFNSDSFITQFAKIFSQKHPNSGGYNILAVDWNAGGSPLGSNPNGLGTYDDFGGNSAVIDAALSIVSDDVFGLTQTLLESAASAWSDASLSATNGIQAARALGLRLANLGIQPEHTMLIGHSNGAGFMGSLALSVTQNLPPADRTQRFAELVALDAPYFTASFQQTYHAAPAVRHLANYYAPIRQLGFGAPMDSWGGTVVTNYRMDATLDPTLAGFNLATALGHEHFRFAIAHSEIPRRYAFTADISPNVFPWGFEASAFESPNSTLDTGASWKEVGPWLPDGVSGRFVELGGGHAPTLLTPVTMPVSQSLVGPVSGSNVYQVFPVTQGGSLSLPAYSFEPQSPAYLMMDVDFPEDVQDLTFVPTVVNPGNEDILQVAVDGEVLGEFDLSTLHLTSGALRLSVRDYAARSARLTFHMPSSSPTTARFVLSDLEFTTTTATVLVDPFPSSGIHGNKFHDLNTNGLRDDGEPGLEGWTIYLDLNNNNALDAGEPSDLPPKTGPGVMRVRGRGAARKRPEGAKRPPA